MSDGDAIKDVTEWVAYLQEIGVRELDATIPSRPSFVATSKAAPQAAPKQPSPKRSPKAAAMAAPQAVPIREEKMSQGETLEQVQADLGDCTRCKLHEGRNKIVFGVGSPQAKLMIIGEGPGADEDASGEPFVGRAGKKLDEMLAAVGLSRDEVYIANIVKCRPPNNRDPERDEVETCYPFLARQIAAISPTAIVALGSPAAKTLLQTKTGITRLRGEWHEYNGIPVMPTFHPAYLLRAYTKENRRKVWEDLKAARARIDE